MTITKTAIARLNTEVTDATRWQRQQHSSQSPSAMQSLQLRRAEVETIDKVDGKKTARKTFRKRKCIRQSRLVRRKNDVMSMTSELNWTEAISSQAARQCITPILDWDAREKQAAASSHCIARLHWKSDAQVDIHNIFIISHFILHVSLMHYININNIQ